MAAYKEELKGWDGLRLSIVIQAAQDYEGALKGKRLEDVSPRQRVGELELFFRSPWFEMLCDLDGEIMIRKIRRKVYRWKHKRALRGIR